MLLQTFVTFPVSGKNRKENLGRGHHYLGRSLRLSRSGKDCPSKFSRSAPLSFIAPFKNWKEEKLAFLRNI